MSEPNPEVIYFVTGNQKKLEELRAILGTDFPVTIEATKIDLPELQGEPEQVAIEKCKTAYRQLKRPVLVEDTSLCFNALEGLPGVYIKWFLEKLGHEGLNKIIAGYDDKSAFAQCIFAYCSGVDADGNEKIETFIGQAHGTIVMPRGPTDFGWDPVFEPAGHSETFAEMKKEVKNSISHRYKSLAKLKQRFGV